MVEGPSLTGTKRLDLVHFTSHLHAGVHARAELVDTVLDPFLEKVVAAQACVLAARATEASALGDKIPVALLLEVGERG
jgi:hypothetical protein